MDTVYPFSQAPAQDPANDAGSTGIRRESLLRHDGGQLVMDVAGPAEGPSVVLAHGFGQTRAAWRATTLALAERGWRVLAYDARGHGESCRAEPDAYRVEDFLADQALVAEHAGGAPVLVGASMGGLTAMAISTDQLRGRVTALVLVDITPRWRPQGMQQILAFLNACPDGFASLEEARQLVADYLPHRAARYQGEDAGASSLMRNLRRGDNGRLYWHWDPALLSLTEDSDSQQQRLLEAARLVRVPTLLVSGGRSELVGDEHVAEFLDLVSHAEHVRIERASHMVAGDENRAFNQTIVRFLERLQACSARVPARAVAQEVTRP